MNGADDFLRRRRAAVAAHPSQIGLDYAAVLPDPTDPSRYFLEFHFIPGSQDKQVAPATLKADNFHFTADGVSVDSLFTRLFPPEFLPPEVPGSRHEVTVGPGQTTVTLGLRFANEARRPGGGTVYTVELVGVPELDPFFSRLDFSFDPEVPLAEDCADTCPPPAVEPSPLAGDYLAKDWTSFRQRMLDSLATVLPEWRERSPADLLVTLVELLADGADRASYYQDAVATEAYLGTARLRTSARRHARLVGYRVVEGVNARVWAHFTASGAGNLEAGTPLLTRVFGLAPAVPEGPEVSQALAAGPTVFETLHTVRLRAEHNEIALYDWGAPSYGLPRGATSAVLAADPSTLAPGDVLIFEEVLGPDSGAPKEANPERRHAVRLTRVTARQDPLAGQDGLAEVAWHAADALPFPLCISNVGSEGRRITGVSVARGNVALADHGRTVAGEELTATAGRFRPVLARRGLTSRVPYDHAEAVGLPAAAALEQDPGDALPALALGEGSKESGEEVPWTLRRDLLTSDRFARDFMAETEDDGTVILRFGDGTLGRAPLPGTSFDATYRVGNGRAGNLGAESLAHVVTGEGFVAAVRNPLPARGGMEPEPLESIRLAAPGRLRALEGGSTESDLARIAETHPEVARAAASLRWTGSWFVLEVAVERRNGLPADEAFFDRVRAFLEEHRQAGWEIVLHPLRYVGLDIAMTVLLSPEASRGAVEQALLATFSNRDLAGGGRGFFHPDNFTFGEPVYLSHIVDAALRVPGVRAVDVSETPPRLNRFRRWGEPSHGELAAGHIRLSRVEIARVDNDPSAPANGRIQFYLEGGR